jgi:parallel beta-helix repeat protein
MSFRFIDYLPVFQSVLLLVYLNSSATTYYVATNGNNSNPGTGASPFASLNRAGQVVVAGDTVLVKAGTYPGFLIRGKNGGSGSWIVFKPYANDEVIIDPYLDDYTDNPLAFQPQNCSYIEFNGFKITDSNPYYDSTEYAYYSQGIDRPGIKVDNYNGASSYIKIVNNKIYHIGENGILTTYYSHHCEIENNIIYETGLSKRGYGIYLGGDNHTLRNNIIHDAYGFGIHIYSTGGTTPDNNLVENNIVYNNGRTDYGKGYPGFPAGGKSRGDGIIIAGGGYYNIVRNTIFYSNLKCGIRISDSNSAEVFNNTVYNNGEEGLNIYPNMNTLIKNNISYQNGGSEIYIGSGNSQDHNLFGIDPKFIDPLNYNFHLKHDSGAIDAGVAISGFNYDFEGNFRPYGNGWDIGAYEFVGKPSKVKNLIISK